MGFSSRSHVTTPTLEIAYESVGPREGTPVVLLHGFPYDVRAFDDVAPILVAAGCRVLAPYLRGFGATRFRSESTLRSGQQAALGQDLIDFLDAVGVDRAVLAGYDWGGRAACIAAALFPSRVAGLVSVGGYNIQDLALAGEPSPPEWERTYWYQYYFHSERGRRGLELNRDELCKLLWTEWSPTWAGAAAAFRASSPSLHNADFVDVVIHSYRHRFGLGQGDPAYDALETLLAAQPSIGVPTVVIESGADGVGGPSASEDRPRFIGPFEHTLLPDTGHNVPQEAPEAFSEAVLSLVRLTDIPDQLDHGPGR
jgi:pimeloyl-ACP methyl ester carboxylesterase